jgi:hypothetical protein
MFELDKYSIKARLYPAFIVLLPTFILSIYYITDFEKYYHYFTALAVVGLFTFLLSQLGRDKGKSKEGDFYNSIGGKPTIQILRHTNKTLDNVTKARYHKLLSQKIEDIQIPSYEEEISNPDNADQVYESCAKFLIARTRDTKKFNLLFKENVSYGFRRNLWGMKTWALVIILLCLLYHSYNATNHFATLNTFSDGDIPVFLLLGVAAFFWLIVVTKKWIKSTAFAYAERLYESLNDL